MQPTHEDVDAQIATMLRDYPRGTTADITPFAVAFLDRDGVRYAFLGEDRVDRLDEELALTDYELEQWQEDIAAFLLEEPHFTHRAEVLDWLRPTTLDCDNRQVRPLGQSAAGHPGRTNRPPCAHRAGRHQSEGHLPLPD